MTAGAASSTAITAADVYQEALLAHESVGAEELSATYEQLLVKAGRQRKTASYYTPAPTADFMSRFSLDLAIRQIGPQPYEIMRITALDPACGAGIFLVHAARFLAAQYAARLVGDAPSAGLVLGVLPTVILNCCYGVDIDPVAAELTRLSLSLETADTLTPQMLERHVICGDTLAGAYPPALADRERPDPAALQG